MSDYISKQALIDWLEEHISHHEESIALVDKGIVFACKLLRDKIKLGEFVASDQGELARLQEAAFVTYPKMITERDNALIESHREAARLREVLNTIIKETSEHCTPVFAEHIKIIAQRVKDTEPVRHNHNFNNAMYVLQEVSELLSWRYEGEHSRADALKLIYTYVMCCDKPNVQKFGPNETIQSSTSVCINCGKMWGINTRESS